MTAVLSAIDEQTREQADDGLNHTVCCHDDNRSLCGKDVTNEPWVEPGIDDECVVCEYLAPLPCGCDCGCCG